MSYTTRRPRFLVTTFICLAIIKVIFASGASASSIGISEEAALIVFGNDNVELKIDKKTGFFSDIRNKITGRSHRLGNDGSWPFGLHLGYPNTPDFLFVEIAANAQYPQEMTYDTVSSSDGETLRMRYGNMLSTGGALTGVKLIIEITLHDGADYFLITAHLENSGTYSITNFFSGTGPLVSADTREQETLVIPGWDYGKLYANPSQFFDKRATYGYPIFGSNCALITGWMDLTGPDGGIGIGYLNRQGLTMLFNAQGAGEGVSINWQLFNLSHENNPWERVGGVFPLPPGQSFTTDPWILACHSGDWHRMADIYRVEYEKAFEGTFLNEKNYNPAAKQIDFVTGFTIHNEANKDAPARKFGEVVGHIKQLSGDLGAQPGNILLVLLGHNEHWPYRMPDFLPCNTEAGGNEECRKMMDDLAQSGMRNVLLYGHPYYNHPKALDYIAQADTGYDHLNRAWPNIGNVACLDSPEWRQLWRDKYIPGYYALGAAGVYWDQGPTQYLVCPRADHPHGLDSLKQLAAHTRGLLDLQQEFHASYADRDPIFWTEAGSDLTGRTMDVWTTTEGGYSPGGVLHREIVRYAVPYHLCANITPTTGEDVNYTLINGFIAWASPSGSDEVMSCQRQYARIRQELRSLNAPGFPFGFKDVIGLKTSDPNLIARSFANEKGVTVLYYAREPVKGDITVDPVSLGFVGKPVNTFTVGLEKNQAGFQIIIP